MPRRPLERRTDDTERPVVKTERAARGGPLSPQVFLVLVASLTLGAIVFVALMAWWFATTP